MRLLGIDLGRKRTGLAVADAETGVVSPLECLELEPGQIIELVVPHVLSGASRRVANLDPTVFWHPTLWNVEEIALSEVPDS